MLDFSRFTHLTFDCYGTLIDWESGILDAMRRILAAHGRQPHDEELLETYGELESQAEAGPYRSYRRVLENVVAGFGEHLGFTPTAEEENSLAESIRKWEPFPDTVAALKRLAARYQLCIISNIDDDLFALTAPKLGARFAHVITAQQVRSYKPNPNNFLRALHVIGVEREHVLHVAQSLFHDIATTRALGISTVWVNRRHGKAGAGATPQADAQPDLVVPDLRTLAEMAEH